MFEKLKKIDARPKPFEFYTAADLWTDEYTSKQMLSYHLNQDVELSSRNLQFIDRSVEWIANRFNVRAGTKIADFGCGPGFYTTRLAQRGADVTGIDFSQNSIGYAKKIAAENNLKINYVVANYLDFEATDSFDLIIMIMCDFCALSPPQRNKMLHKFYKMLAPGGSVLLDVHSLTTFEQRKEGSIFERNLLDGFWSPDEYYGFLNTFKYDEQKLILDKYTIIEVERTRTIYNWLQCFSHDDLKSEFQDCGFKIDRLYSDVAGAPLDPASEVFAIVAQK